MANDVAKIKQVVSQYVKAANADDLQAWQKTLTNDVVFMPADTPKASGKQAVVAAIKAGFFDPFRIKLAVKLDRAQVFGSQAFVPASFTLALTPKAGGKTVKRAGKAMHEFRKQKDGSWKYAMLIWNFDGPA